ncbi:S1C family serine protease [Bacillus sp. JCM 19034]|uniref:S1C family serine protease n=1 Tax=Bacillus sp. JCM 19034 TaxID=1481928 RepID=UPI0007818BCC|nr:serine protease [Bacillus sp. JCM 19034]
MLTNHHVIDQNEPFRISLPNGDQYMAEVIDSIENPDLALLKVEGDDLPYLPLREYGAKIDEKVYVIGNPGLQQSIVSEGEIDRTEGHYQRMRITNTILPGHSGSPVLSKDGQVVGVVYARTIGNDSGYGLAVPLEQIYEHFPHLKEELYN